MLLGREKIDLPVFIFPSDFKERLFFVQIEDKKRQIQSEKETKYLE